MKNILIISTLILCSVVSAWGGKAEDTSKATAQGGVEAPFRLEHPSVPSLIDRGKAAFDAKDYDIAIGHYQTAIEYLDPISDADLLAIVRHQMGFAYWARGDTKQAIEQFQENLAFHRTKSDIRSISNYLLYIGKAELRQNRPEVAYGYLNENSELIEENPSRYEENQYYLIKALLRTGKKRRALEVLRSTDASLSKTHTRAYLKKAAFLLDADLEGQDRTRIHVVYVIPIVLVVLFVLTLGLKGHHRVSVRLREMALLLLSVTSGLAIVELFLYLSDSCPNNIRHLLHPPGRVTQFQPLPDVMPGITRTSTRFTINNAGIRGDTLPKDAFRVLAVGGSSTEGLFLDDEDAWPYLLQQQLAKSMPGHVWVGNAGKSALNSFSHRVQVHFYLQEIRPDMIIVQAGINDMNQCISGGKQAVINNALASKRPDYPYDHRKHVFHSIKPREKTHGLRILERIEMLFRPEDGSAFDYDFVTQDAAGEFHIYQRQRRQRADKSTELPDISPCLQAFSENMEHIINQCIRRSVEIILLTQGSMYRDDLTAAEEDLLWFGSVDQNPFSKKPPREYYDVSVMKKLLDQYNRITLSLCSKYNLQCLDSDKYLEQSTNSYYDDVHLNKNGSRMLAKKVCGIVEEFVD